MTIGRRILHLLDTSYLDLRVALRGLKAAPGVTAVAIVSLALGIGANTAIFKVVQETLLQPLPYGAPERLVRLWELYPGPQGLGRGSVSVPNLVDWWEQSTTLDGIAAFQPGQSFNLAADGGAVRVRGTLATPQLFDLLGVDPLLGTVFRPSGPSLDEVVESQVVVLSYNLWQSHYAGEPDIVGQQVRVQGENYTVLGVMPPGFRFPPRSDDQLWAPLGFDAALREKRGTHWLQVLGRVSPQATTSQAEADLQTVAGRLAEAYPDAQEGRSATLKTLHEATVGNRRSQLLALWGAVGLVFLIACGNVSNLLLARFASRRREFALRSALGAGRGQLLQQVLIESLMLAVAAGALGWLLALGAIRLLAMAPGAGIPAAAVTSGSDTRMLAACALASLLGGLLCGLLPAWRSTRHLHREHVGGSAGRGTRPGRDRLRSALVMVEIALAVVVLMGSLLMVRSLLRLAEVDSGLRAERVLTLRLELPEAKYRQENSSAAATHFFETLLERVQALPGSEQAGLINMLPMQSWGFNGNFSIDGYEPASRQDAPLAEYRAVSSDLFRTLGIPLLSGPGLQDDPAPDGEVQVVINRTLAERYWPGEDAVGRRLGWSSQAWWRVVGVVGDVKSSGLDRDTEAVIYLHYRQMERLQFPLLGVSLVVRTRAEPLALTESIRHEVRVLDAEQPIFQVRTLQQVVDEHLSERRFHTGLLSVFASLALILVIAGVYGVMSYSVERRMSEMGLRMALGARRQDVLRQVLREGVALAAAGAAGGIAAALLLTRFLESQLFGVAATDPLTFALTILVVLLVAVLASLVPARRATTVDPVTALRAQ